LCFSDRMQCENHCLRSLMIGHECEPSLLVKVSSVAVFSSIRGRISMASSLFSSLCESSLRTTSRNTSFRKKRQKNSDSNCNYQELVRQVYEHDFHRQPSRRTLALTLERNHYTKKKSLSPRTVHEGR